MPIAINGSGSITGLTKTGISAQPVFPGNVIQVVNYQTGAYASGTTPIPFDDTIPQNTEGTEFMILAITPTNASSKLLIEVTAFIANSTSQWVNGALFQDSTANALAAITNFNSDATGGEVMTFSHYMTAGTTSSTTFKFRAGCNVAATTYLNGQAARFLGGVMASSITIMEIAA
jgi:hypothetical protein